MKYIKPVYETQEHITSSLLYKYKFHKNLENNMVYRFPVYKYKNKPLIYCDFIFNEEEKQIHINCFDTNNNSCAYNEEYYGKSDVAEIVNKNIQKELNFLIKEGVIKE